MVQNNKQGVDNPAFQGIYKPPGKACPFALSSPATPHLHSADGVNWILDWTKLGKRPRINVDYAEAVWCEWASFTLVDTSLAKVEPSPPYIQALNVGVERSGGVGKDKSRSMRASSKLPCALGKKITEQQFIYSITHTKMDWKTPWPLSHMSLVETEWLWNTI